VARCIEEAGMGFLFAPAFHPAMKFAGVPRRELGVPTVFNVLGPLTNPARPQYQLLGVSSVEVMDLVASSLLKLGVTSALVVHSADGMDEISLNGPTQVREVRTGQVRAYEVEPGDFGVSSAGPEAIRGGDAETNSAILRGILDGERSPARDAAVINAAAALYASDRASDMHEGARLAADALDSRAAKLVLERLVAVSQGARAEIESAA
jgi:anthranilate phosphoribosyltransferase